MRARQRSSDSRLPRRIVAAALAAFLLLPCPSFAFKPPQWNRIRYQGGSIDVRVNPLDWNTTLSLVDDQLEMDFAGRKTLKVPIEKIARIAYGEKAYRRTADKFVVNAGVSPPALFGLLRKTKDHMVSIEFETAEGRRGAVLLTVHEKQIRSLMQALSLATHKRIEDWP